MIFRDKQNGALLNVRRDNFTNDRRYFQEMIRIEGEGMGEHTGKTRTPHNARPFDEYIHSFIHS